IEQPGTANKTISEKYLKIALTPIPFFISTGILLVPLLCEILINWYYFYDNKALTKKQIKHISFDCHTLGYRQSIDDITQNIFQPSELTLRSNTNAI
ncbi:hypothetical protein MLT65_24735, partial [Escherichia coli]|nr:hypothetical protein [Escherichia coli]MCN8430313.1 hypothetical protein [Escherichia coli]MCN8737767.1 hypothetical protein [Escherichia coli]